MTRLHSKKPLRPRAAIKASQPAIGRPDFSKVPAVPRIFGYARVSTVEPRIMPKKRTREQLIEAASEAHTDMALLEAVVKICDGSDISANRFRTTQRIIQLCQNEQQRCLADYDRAVAEASE